MNEACSSGVVPPPSKRLRLSRNRQDSSKRPPLESLDLHSTLDQIHRSHLEEPQQPGAAAGWRFEKDKQRSDVNFTKASHSDQRYTGSSSTRHGESIGRVTPLYTNNVEVSRPYVDVGDPGPSEQPQSLGDKPAVECASSTSRQGGDQTFASSVIPCQQPGDTREGEEEKEGSADAEAGETSPEINAWGGRGGRGQQQETVEILANCCANPNVLVGHGNEAQVTVDDARGSGAPPSEGKLELCSSHRPAAENVADGETATSFLLSGNTPVEDDPSSPEVVHQIVREESDYTNDPESSSHELGRSTGDPVEPECGNPSKSLMGAEENSSLLRTGGEIPDGNLGFPQSQHHHMESGLSSAETVLVSEGSLPFAFNQPLVESPATGALTSGEENMVPEDVAANSLRETGDIAEANGLHSTNSPQMITEEQIAVVPGPTHNRLPSGGVLPFQNQQTVGNRVEIRDSTEEEDITVGDVVNILARTDRIIRAIEVYSRSPDHRTTEDQVAGGVSILNRGLHSEGQLTSRHNERMVELTGEVLESSREVTAEDVANIYAQAGAIAQAANNWFSLSESARNRAIANANWGSLVQGNMPGEPERLRENIITDHRRSDEAADQSLLQSQEPNAPDSLSCPICMEPWTNTGEHRICSLACGHLFGKSCIKRWIKQRGRRIGKCPHCNKRAKVEDIRNIYVPHIAVSDGYGHEVAQEVKQLKSENEDLKRTNSELHLEMARLQLETDRLRHLQAMATGAGIVQKVEHNRFDEPANARKRQAQSSLQTFFGNSDRRRSRKDFDEHRLDGRPPKFHVGTSGHRSSSSLASIGTRGLGENFILQDEIHLLGGKVFDMEDHSQLALVSARASNHGSIFGLTKVEQRILFDTYSLDNSVDGHIFIYVITLHRAPMLYMMISLLTLSDVQHVSLPPGLGAIRDVRFPPFSVGTPGKLALVASLGKRLSLFSLQSNTIVLEYPLQSAPWSCAWDSVVPNQVYAGLQNGSLLIFDLRQTSSPMASFPGSSTRPVHTLQAVQSQSRKGILSASNSGAYFWDMGTSASFTEIQRPLCISDEQKEKLCVSLAYAPCLKTAVASFRPSPLAQTEASSSAPAVSQADNTSQSCGTLRGSLEPSSSSTQQTTTQDTPSHCVLRSHLGDSCSSPESTEGGRREWRWEGGKGMMVGHKSVSVMPRSTIVVEPVDDDGLRASFAYGDEGTNAVWLWDMNTLNVTQTLVPHQSPVLDVKYVNIGERMIMGCISEKTFQLYRRPSLN